MMPYRILTIANAVLLLVSCTGMGLVTPDGAGPPDVGEVASGDIRLSENEIAPTDGRQTSDHIVPDLVFDSASSELIQGCLPGEGCFLDKCVENSQCLAGWCVDHMGEGVCSMNCSQECPDGWSCQQVAGTAPDLVYVCVSNHANLCRPCATSADCKSVGGAEDVCIRYDTQGSFCGGSCQSSQDCPWGFACLDAETVDGIATTQCVSDAGVCPCTEKSVALGLWTPCASENEFGLCTGKRVCAAEGLTNCDAASPATELCDGLDNDCDGDIDNPLLVEGKFKEICDDENPCTTDSCLGADGCSHESLNQGECVDGDSCTVGDHCEEGTCVGLPIACDDADPCTDDFCDGLGGCTAEFNTAECDDNDPCTVNDQCDAGECDGFDVDCGCQADADCAALEDGDLCNGTLFCDTAALPYQCEVAADTVIECPEPEGSDAICLAPLCDPLTGACSLIATHEGFPCDDGDQCTLGDNCTQGTCTAGVAANCNDGNPCTNDGCDVGTGCFHEPNTSECTDGDACTSGDQCAAGECVGTGLLDCNDGNPCTDDSCDATAGCLHLFNQAQCSDGDACTVGDQCFEGICVHTGLEVCDDANPCTSDSCSPANGCIFQLNNLPCDDSDVCTQGDHCHLGECIQSSDLVCNDQNPCTDDSCDPATGCTATPNAAPCDDLNFCTDDDHCSGGWCVAGVLTDCDDGNPCTDDSCDPGAGCVHAHNSGPCSDNDMCTLGDVCSSGECLPGNFTLPCDDDNICTVDSCNPALGCVVSNGDGACDDANPCTVGDICADGLCLPGNGALDCNDPHDCTQDSCDPVGGCQHAPQDPSCEDGNSCTNNSCDVDAGCVLEHVANCCGNGQVEPGEECDDGNQQDGDECPADCVETGGCVKVGVDVRTLLQPPEDYQLGPCDGSYCEDSQATIPMGWHIALAEEVAVLTPHLQFGACAAYGICGSYWYGGGQLTSNCNALKYNCTTGGCWAYTTHCYTQVLLIKDGKDGTCVAQ